MSALALRLGLNRTTVVGLAGPILIVLILGMMVLPLPPFLLDLLFTFNIALAMIVLLVGDVHAAPARLRRVPDGAAAHHAAAAVAQRRLDARGADARPHRAGRGGQGDRGLRPLPGRRQLRRRPRRVRRSWWSSTSSSSPRAPGGSPRSAARFTLDAMPGKQMAIDADLNAGLIGEDEARRRRAGDRRRRPTSTARWTVPRKFVRGDAIAGILILFINIIGGLAIGDLPARPRRWPPRPTTTRC